MYLLKAISALQELLNESGHSMSDHWDAFETRFLNAMTEWQLCLFLIYTRYTKSVRLITSIMRALYTESGLNESLIDLGLIETRYLSNMRYVSEGGSRYGIASPWIKQYLLSAPSLLVLRPSCLLSILIGCLRRMGISLGVRTQKATSN